MRLAVRTVDLQRLLGRPYGFIGLVRSHEQVRQRGHEIARRWIERDRLLVSLDRPLNVVVVFETLGQEELGIRLGDAIRLDGRWLHGPRRCGGTWTGLGLRSL